MPNPGGINNFNKFAPEPAYGEVSNQQRLEQAAPLAGQQIVSGPINAPKRAQRAAQRKPRGDMPQLPGQPPASPQSIVASFWAQAATLPGASDLVKEMASDAQQVP